MPPKLLARRARALVIAALPVLAACGGVSSAPWTTGDADEESGPLSPFARAFVDAHNAVRAAVDPTPATPLPPVVWRAEVAAVAAAWAARCVFEHSQGALGENLALFSSASTTPDDVVQAWASEVADYDYANNRCVPGAQCGHYTQVVWRDSAGLGCAVAACDDIAGFGAGRLFVCNYDPPGNFVGARPY